MTEFKRLKPSAEVQNLRKWGPGRLSQLKLFTSHFETAFNTSLAAQVVQSPKRKFSEFVPRIVPQEVATEIEYREIRIAWVAPKGLRNFLLYEIQASLEENFFQFDQFITFDPFFVFPNLLDGRLYYLRIRVVTKDGLFGPWSDVEEVTTPRTQVLGISDGTEIVSNIRFFRHGNVFQPVFTRTYTSIGGSLYYTVDYELEVLALDDPSFLVDWSDIEFRWTFNGDQVGQDFLVTVYSINDGDRLGNPDTDMEVRTADIGTIPGNSLILPGPAVLKRRGTFVQKFEARAAGTHEISLAAHVTAPGFFSFPPHPNDWIFLNDGRIPGRGAIIRLKNFNVFEILIE